MKAVCPKGFTLIELLLGVAIFVILVAIVVVYAKYAILRSRNSNIATDVAEIRKIAYQMYLERGSYKDVCALGSENFLNSANPDLDHLQDDIENLGGRVEKCLAQDDSYCITVTLAGNKGFYCIDDEGRFSFLQPGEPDPCENANSICP